MQTMSGMVVVPNFITDVNLGCQFNASGAATTVDGEPSEIYRVGFAVQTETRIANPNPAPGSGHFTVTQLGYPVFEDQNVQYSMLLGWRGDFGRHYVYPFGQTPYLVNNTGFLSGTVTHSGGGRDYTIILSLAAEVVPGGGYPVDQAYAPTGAIVDEWGRVNMSFSYTGTVGLIKGAYDDDVAGQDYPIIRPVPRRRGVAGAVEY